MRHQVSLYMGLMSPVAQRQGSPYGSNSGVAAKWGGGQRVDGTAWEGWWGLVRQKKKKYERDILVSTRRWGNAIWLCRRVFTLEEWDGDERGMCCWHSLLERTATVAMR